VTGTLDVSVTVRVDSLQFLFPSWLTYLLEKTQPSALPLVQGGVETRVRVPGTVSHGFDVQNLTPSVITVREKGLVGVALPSLAVHSVEPDLAKLEVRTQTAGWMRALPSDLPEAVRTQALGVVTEAFRTQAERRIDTATQAGEHCPGPGGDAPTAPQSGRRLHSPVPDSSGGGTGLAAGGVIPNPEAGFGYGREEVRTEPAEFVCEDVRRETGTLVENVTQHLQLSV
jgi:hypothetical protein